MEVVMQKCLPPGWEFFHNIGSGSVAGIIVAWDKQGPLVSLLSTSDQMMLLSVTMEMKTFVISIVYGYNQAGNRKKLWDDLRTSYGLVGLQPWILMGDFNVVRWQNERSDHGYFDATSAGDFNTCLEDIGMEDINTTGFLFTWSNRRAGREYCGSRLDRVVVNAQWQHIFTESEAVVLTPGVSDHCPLTVSILPYQGGKKPFKFFNFWMTHKSFDDILNFSWAAQINSEDSPMLLLYKKLRRLKPCLKKLNKDFYSDIQKRVLAANAELAHIQNSLGLVC
ncbi:hypothetical protein RHSIM_Rhsim01G0069200 [Rhododendron simsii]|uniref:Endonuclease/exonuclease/phosphatase domain-containing protein n=1 Tax=Rhododendron simsii TaxID=118357 RepID=A0A834HGQ3_RHOSS|nr:hypothetical protein RHSIM_Rhsim01G0069200 [Rhododendron simsii]